MPSDLCGQTATTPHEVETNSAAHRVFSNETVFVWIMDLFSFITIVAASQVCTQWANTMEVQMSNILNSPLGELVDSPHIFCSMMQRTKSLLSGSFVLSIIMRNGGFDTWTPNNLDLYTSMDAGETAIDFLRTKGYVITARGPPR